jgi:hypothetical protein
MMDHEALAERVRTVLLDEIERQAEEHGDQIVVDREPPRTVTYDGYLLVDPLVDAILKTITTGA